MRRFCAKLAGIFLILEILLRSFDAVKFGRNFWDARIYVPDKHLIWKYNPGYRGRIYQFHDMRVNSEGLIGAELKAEKPKNEVRILFLGESVLLGTGASSYDEAYIKVLERRLQQRKDSREYVLLNAATPSYSSYNGLQFVKYRLQELKIDFLVIGFGWNDNSFDITSDKDTDKDWCFYSLAVSGVTNLSRGLKYMLQFQRILLKEKNQIETEIKAKLGISVNRERRGLPRRVPLPDYLENMRNMAKICHANQVKPVFITLPRPHNVFINSHKIEAIDIYNRELKKLAQQNHYLMADVDSAFSLYPYDEFFPDYTQQFEYPNAAGHKLMGEVIYSALFADAGMIQEEENLQY